MRGWACASARSASPWVSLPFLSAFHRPAAVPPLPPAISPISLSSCSSSSSPHSSAEGPGVGCGPAVWLPGCASPPEPALSELFWGEGTCLSSPACCWSLTWAYGNQRHEGTEQPPSSSLPEPLSATPQASGIAWLPPYVSPVYLQPLARPQLNAWIPSAEFLFEVSWA